MLSQYTRTATTQRLLEGEVRKKLELMESDPALNTTTSYSANGTLYPDHQMPFVDKHIAYLMNHPKVDYTQYLANLRLMLKIRR
jgi:hypothetical protein